MNISEKFDSLNKTKTTSSESKGKLGRLGKGLGTALAFKTKLRSQKYKKARYDIGNVSDKDLSKIIKEFQKIGKVHYVKSIPKHEPTSSYFHLVRQLAKCMMRSDEQNRHVHSIMRKILLCHRTLMLQTRTNKNKSSCTKLYQRINLRT